MVSAAVATRSLLGGREKNEDCVADARSGARLCCVVSDGAGGHGGGALASRIVVEHVIGGFQARPIADPADLSDLILDAHDAVLREQRTEKGDAAHMHATVVVLVIDTGCQRAFWGHVGDSRLYVFRGGCVHAVTRDDSVVQWMVDAGHLDPAAARSHPRKNQLFAALGMSDALRPQTSAPDVAVEEGDAFLLCSDGWWESLSDDEIAAAIGGAVSAEDWLARMERLIGARSGPDHDNYSAVAVWIGDPNRTVLPVPGLTPPSCAQP